MNLEPDKVGELVESDRFERRDLHARASRRVIWRPEAPLTSSGASTLSSTAPRSRREPRRAIPSRSLRALPRARSLGARRPAHPATWHAL